MRLTTRFLPPLNSVTISVGTMISPKYLSSPAIATRRCRPSRIESSRLLCTLRMYQFILRRLVDDRRLFDRPRGVVLGFDVGSASAAASSASAAIRRRLASAARLVERLVGAAHRPAARRSAAIAGRGAHAARRGAARCRRATASVVASSADDSSLASSGNSLAIVRVLRSRQSIACNVSADLQLASLRQHPRSAATAAARTGRSTNRIAASKKIAKITTIELRTNSRPRRPRTLFISASTAIKKSANCGMFTSR